MNPLCPPISFNPRTPVLWPDRFVRVFLIIISFLLLPFTTFAQLGRPQTPQFTTTAPVSTLNNPSGQNRMPIQSPSYDYSTPSPLGLTAQDIINQTNANAMKAAGYNPPQVPPSDPYLAHQFIMQQQQDQRMQSMQMVQGIMNETVTRPGYFMTDSAFRYTPAYTSGIKGYNSSLNEIKGQLKGSKPLSVRKAYFMMEAAYGNSYMSWEEYNATVDNSVKFIRTWMKQQGLSTKNPEAAHYAIQRFMRDTLSITQNNPENNGYKTTQHLPLIYDYEDYQGYNDYRNYFSSKCLATGSGQCNSLPLVYLILAEGLGVKAYLCFAPMHSFIKYRDNKGLLKGYEPTSHWEINDQWYVENLGITPAAIQSKIYLDTIGRRRMVAHCAVDLAINYMYRYGIADESFIAECIKTAMPSFNKHQSLFIYAAYGMMLKRKLDQLMSSAGVTDLTQVGSVPGAGEIYDLIVENEQVIAALGWQPMSEQMYQQMLQQQSMKSDAQKSSGQSTKTKKNLFITKAINK